MTRGGPGGHLPTRRRAEAHCARRGLEPRYRLTARGGRGGTGRLRTTGCGHAERDRPAAGCPEGRGPPPKGNGGGEAPTAAPFGHSPLAGGQSSNQDTEAVSAAGAVRRRSARIPREATVWTVDIRMARS